MHRIAPRVDGACVLQTIPETAGVIVATAIENRDFPTCFEVFVKMGKGAATLSVSVIGPKRSEITWPILPVSTKRDHWKDP